MPFYTLRPPRRWLPLRVFDNGSSHARTPCLPAFSLYVQLCGRPLRLFCNLSQNETTSQPTNHTSHKPNLHRGGSPSLSLRRAPRRSGCCCSRVCVAGWFSFGSVGPLLVSPPPRAWWKRWRPPPLPPPGPPLWPSLVCMGGHRLVEICGTWLDPSTPVLT